MFNVVTDSNWHNAAGWVQVSPAEKEKLRSELMAASGIADKYEARFDNESYFKVGLIESSLDIC